MRRATIAALAVVLALATASAGAAESRAPQFAFEDVNPRSASHGELVSLDALLARGGVVLNFVASWCGPCWLELPDFQSLYETGDAPIVAVAADEYTQPSPGLLARLESVGATMPVLLVPEDEIDAMERRYGHSVLPSTYVIDGDGRIRQVFQGIVSNEQLAQAVRSHLADSGAISAPSP